jgi:hypothetical protein
MESRRDRYANSQSTQIGMFSKEYWKQIILSVYTFFYLFFYSIIYPVNTNREGNTNNSNQRSSREDRPGRSPYFRGGLGGMMGGG